MNISPSALAFLLLVATFTLTMSCPREAPKKVRHPVGHDLMSPCCQKYSKGKFRKDRVKSYFITDSHCRLYSVVFVFKNELKGCADPNAQWAKDLMEYLDNKKNPTSSTPPAVPTPSA